jgi:hypothetical protein
MTAVLSQQTRLSYSARPSGFTRATTSILLNPNYHHQPSSLPSSSYPSCSNPHPSTQSLSSSASSSEDVNTPPSSDNATPPLTNSLTLPCVSEDDRLPRQRTGSAQDCTGPRIRFAPLPVPRRAVCVTEHGEELPLPAVFDDDDPSITSHPPLRNFHAQSLLLEGSVAAPKQLSAIITSDPSPRQQSLRPPTKNRLPSSPTPSTSTVTPVTLSKRFLPSFWHKSDESRSSGSRDSSSSRDGSPTSFGIPLGHWVSADAASRRGSTSSTNGAPLARAQSASSTSRKPKRLLNGRVYGARKHPNHTPANPFANVPDKEPEFVEWGHGGMGSVRAGGMWAKVQSDQRLLIGHTEERGRRGTPTASHADEDDGGGMGWVKKRREEREQKKREEQAAREAASKANVVSTSSPVSDATSSPTSSQLSANHTVSTITLTQPTPENDDEDDSDDEEEAKDDSLDDESSSTEQEDDDAAEVRCLVPFLPP